MKIGIVNDLPLAVEIIRRTLLNNSNHKVHWIAKNGNEAVQKCKDSLPDLILMDIQMPVMDGVEATRQIMNNTPCPILIVTASVNTNSSKVFEALGSGALDAVNTPILDVSFNNQTKKSTKEFIKKLSALEKIINCKENILTSNNYGLKKTNKVNNLIVVGSSAGGPAALEILLRPFPVNFRGSIVIVQHIDASFSEGLAKWLDELTQLKVRLAVEGDYPSPGTVLIAGKNEHLIFNADKSLGYSKQPENLVNCPSIDIFFESAVLHWRDQLYGVVLTGMGKDGAIGLKMIKQANHHTVVQDKASSSVFGMPKAAIELGAATKILPINEIGMHLIKIANNTQN